MKRLLAIPPVEVWVVFVWAYFVRRQSDPASRFPKQGEVQASQLIRHPVSKGANVGTSQLPSPGVVVASYAPPYELPDFYRLCPRKLILDIVTDQPQDI